MHIYIRVFTYHRHVLSTSFQKLMTVYGVEEGRKGGERREKPQDGIKNEVQSYALRLNETSPERITWTAIQATGEE